jgi:heat shock protein HslJ
MAFQQPIRAAFILAMLAGFHAVPPAWAEADGPDHFRVVGVKLGNVLNIRSEPSRSGKVVGKAPADADGLRNLGCQGGMTLDEFTKASEAERAAARYRRWCKVEFQGTTGWAAGWHLGEGQGPAGAMATEPALLGTRWALTSLSGAPAKGEAWMSLSEDGRVTGNAGCNGFNGSAKVVGDTIEFGPLASTMMACTEDGLSAQEAGLHGILAGKTAYSLRAGKLTVSQPSGGASATFGRANQ